MTRLIIILITALVFLSGYKYYEDTKKHTATIIIDVYKKSEKNNYLSISLNYSTADERKQILINEAGMEFLKRNVTKVRYKDE